MPTGTDESGPADGAALRQRIDALRQELEQLGPDSPASSPGPGEQLCARDGIPTRFVCTRCGLAICPNCLVRTDVGLRCPTHGGRAEAAPRRPERRREMAAAALAGAVLVVGLAVGRWSESASPMASPALAPLARPSITVTPATSAPTPEQSPPATASPGTPGPPTSTPAPEPTTPQAPLDVPDAPTVVALNGAGVDFAPGRQVVWTPKEALITPTVDRPTDAGCGAAQLAAGNQVHIQVEGDVSYGITLIAPQGQPLTAQPYLNVGNSSALSCDPPAGAFDQTGPTTCGHTASFTVLEVAFNSDGTLARLAAVFEQRCVGTGFLLRGEIRYRATVPPVPV